jgi:hypothetical protein
MTVARAVSRPGLIGCKGSYFRLIKRKDERVFAVFCIFAPSRTRQEQQRPRRIIRKCFVTSALFLIFVA